MPDFSMGEAPGACESPTASLREPTTPKRPPKRPRPETPKRTTQPAPTLGNWQLPGQSVQDTPPASPSHETPQSQLGLELRSHIAAAVASRTAEIKTTGDEVLDLVSMISQKVSSWEEKGLRSAAALGKDFRTLVLNFSKNLASGDTTKWEENHQSSPSAHRGYAEAAKKAPANIPKTQPKLHETPHKSPQLEKPPRIFLRLPKDHAARRASPYATMDTLRKHLDKTCSTAVKEVQQVPSGLAIWPKDGLGLQLLMERRETLECLLQGSKVEMEQKWAIFVLPNTPRQYTSFEGTQEPINKQMALDEFKLQSDLSPLKFYFSNKNPLSSTLVMAVPEYQARAVPKWINLFGKNVQVKHKPLRARIEQCTRCWDYHNPRTCTRTPRCRICSKRDHTEESHPSPEDEGSSDPCCTNCCGPFLADHSNCPTRPTVHQGTIQRLSKSQYVAVRKAGARQFMLKDLNDTNEPSGSPGPSPTREQSQP